MPPRAHKCLPPLLLLLLCGVVCAPGCSDEVALQAPGPGDPCAREGDRYAQTLVCRGGLWQPQAQGLDMGPQGAGADAALPQDAGCETVAQVCARLGAQCGVLTEVVTPCTTLPQVDCGGCQGTNEGCDQATNQCQCMPETDQELCAVAGKTCDSPTLTDRCGTTRTRDCGSCPGGGVCTSLGVCCTPRTDAQLCGDTGVQCGSKMVTDNCGNPRIINCGSSCPGSYDSCNQATHQCQCDDTRTDAQLCADSDLQCGMKSVQDGCSKSRTLDCGSAARSCAAPNTLCMDNQCVCQPQTDAQLCATKGAQCGYLYGVLDNCGVQRSRVNCGGPDSCGRDRCCDDFKNRCIPGRFDCL